MELLWDSWIAVGLASVAVWGLSCVVDVCFVGEGIYRKPIDGMLLAGLFCVLPLLNIDGVKLALDVEPEVAAVGLLAGVFYLLHIFLYFNALFRLNDATNAEIFNTLSVLFVPVLAFVLLGETLQPLHYVAIGLSLLGVLLLVRFQLSILTWQVTLLLGGSVLSISLVMVMQSWVLGHVAYEGAISLYSLGAFVSVLCLLSANGSMRRRIVRICRRFGLLVVGIEVLELGAMLGLQRATDVGPSVSLVALLECSLPLFVMAFSWMVLGVSRYGRLTVKDRIRAALSLQTDAFATKLLSLVFIVAAIGLAQT